MSDVFVSYSRKDTLFVNKLHTALTTQDREVWVDWHDIPLTANWWAEICAGIEATHTFVFVISPDSIASPVCHLEIAYAERNNKRLVPIVHIETDVKTALEALQTQELDEHTLGLLDGQDLLTIARSNWQHLSRHNWLFFEEEANFDSNFQRLLKAIDTDLEYVRIHTRLLMQSIEWEAHHHSDSFLLIGVAIAEADDWLASSADKTPHPTDRHLNFIMSSHRHAGRRQRYVFIGITVALAIMIGLSILSLTMFGQAVQSIGHSNMTEHMLETQLSNVKATNVELEIQITRTP